MQIKNIGKEKALQKIKIFCSYQERCHQEVRDKLYGFGLYKNEVELLLTSLINEGFLDEQRFAIAFAGGKSRIKNWGKVKIRFALKQKGISDYCITKALETIDSDYYNKSIKKLFKEKQRALSYEKNIFSKKAKMRSYLLSKGYEADLVYQLTKHERNENHIDNR